MEPYSLDMQTDIHLHMPHKYIAGPNQRTRNNVVSKLFYYLCLSILCYHQDPPDKLDSMREIDNTDRFNIFH